MTLVIVESPFATVQNVRTEARPINGHEFKVRAIAEGCVTQWYISFDASEAAKQAKRQLAIDYARDAMRDALMRGEAPFANHLLYTQDGVLDDDKPTERSLGIEAGLRWGEAAEKTVVYTDLGISSGMKLGIRRAKENGRPVEYRTLEAWKNDQGN